MTIEEISEIGSALGVFLLRFRRCFSHKPTFRHFGVYVRGLLSDLPRKSVEPIALAAGSTVRTLQLFLTFHRWDAGAREMRVHFVVAGSRAPGYL